MFYTRQRTTDLLTQMAVTVQGYLALDLVKKNNVELVKGVDRASTTTVSALRTAVTVASAMSNQRLVLEQITALNTTTAGMIDTTGELLKTQSGAIHEQASSSTIPLETLQRAFQNIYDTMDQIDAFKLAALANMKQTVDDARQRGREVEGLYRPRRGRRPGQAREPELAVRGARGEVSIRAMTGDEIGRLFAQAEERFDRAAADAPAHRPKRSPGPTRCHRAGRLSRQRRARRRPARAPAAQCAGSAGR